MRICMYVRVRRDMADFSPSAVRRCFKNGIGWLFLIFVVLSILLLVLMEIISPHLLASLHDNSLGDVIADSRCICVCPHNLNATTRLNSTIFVRQVDDAGDCVCEDTVPIEKEANLELEMLCLRCECNYESRNSAEIAVIVYSVMVIVFCLMPPCALFVCIYPFVARRQQLANSRGPSYSPLQNPPSPYSRSRHTSRRMSSNSSNNRGRSMSPGDSVVIHRLQEVEFENT